MTLWHGPTGKLVKGHVLDVNEKAFNEALREVDSRLYTFWNPKKLKGWGCWEIRTKPTKLTSIYQGTHEGQSFYRLYEVEFDHIHHVIDCAFLNYDVIRKIKEMDTFAQIEKSGHQSYEDVLNGLEEAHREETRAKAREELKYALKQNSSAARDFYEAVKSGIHPAQVLLSTNWALKS